MFTSSRASGETGATNHVITHINSNVCLLEINPQPDWQDTEAGKHGNILAIFDYLSLQFTNTLDK